MRITIVFSFITFLSLSLAIDNNDSSDDDYQLQLSDSYNSKSSNDEENSKPKKCPSKHLIFNRCKLPNCRCSGTDIPGGLKPSDTPQMVVLTFQNGIRKEDLSKYQSLFTTKNPNGCSTTGTFYAAHEFTDYFTVQTLRSNEHEIGVNGIDSSHSQDWWKTASEDDWANEMGGEKEILTLLANISSDSISGERAPYLQMGGDNQISAMKKCKITYDASRVSIEFSSISNLLWPYTYDYLSTQDCVVEPCPKESAKGIWQVPLLALTDQYGSHCSTLDACNATTRNEVFVLLYKAFRAHYTSNKAPLVLTLSSRWVGDQQKLSGMTDFISYLRGLQDVYVVSADRMLAWIKKPTVLSELSNFTPWKCDQPAPYVCPASEAVTCRYDASRKFVAQEGPEVVYRTTTCRTECPVCYPWINDTKGTKC